MSRRGGARRGAVLALGVLLGVCAVFGGRHLARAREVGVRPSAALRPASAVKPASAVRPVSAVKPGPAVRVERAVADAAIVDGKAIAHEMRKARGRGLFVHLWASWCGPCLEELPLVDVFARVARERGATFVSVSLDDVRRGAHVADVLRRKAPGLTPFVAKFDDPADFMSLFSATWEGAIPALFGYGPDGLLKGSVVGEPDPEDLDELLAEIAPRSSPVDGPSARTIRRP